MEGTGIFRRHRVGSPWIAMSCASPLAFSTAVQFRAAAGIGEAAHRSVVRRNNVVSVMPNRYRLMMLSLTDISQIILVATTDGSRYGSSGEG